MRFREGDFGCHTDTSLTGLEEYPLNADEYKKTRRVNITDVTSMSAPITKCPVVIAIRGKDAKLSPSWNSLNHAPIPRTI